MPTIKKGRYILKKDISFETNKDVLLEDFLFSYMTEEDEIDCESLYFLWEYKEIIYLTFNFGEQTTYERGNWLGKNYRVIYVQEDYNATDEQYNLFTENLANEVVVALYNNISEENRLTKTIPFNDLQDCVLKLSTDILNPQIILNVDVAPTANYAFIPSLGRYYFITNVQYISYKHYMLTLHVDVLMTYGDIILQQTAYISRCESPQFYNLDLIDANFLISNETETTITRISNSLFPLVGLTKDNICYCLTVVNNE